MGDTHNKFVGEAHGAVIQAGTIHELTVQLAAPVEAVVPRELPVAPIGFVNRDQELTVLDGLLSQADRSVGPTVAIVSGMHGVGKSALGSHWANHARNRFDGGDLFGEFSKRRHHGGVDVSDVLGDFIRDLGAPDGAIPPTLAERAKLFRRLTASRRLLVLLDDVDYPAQVMPLLPAGAGSVVVITTNSHLEELLQEGAKLVRVQPLDADAARRLLVEMAGAVRIDDDPDSTARILKICGGLPIALCVCGGRLARHTTRSVAWLADEIADKSTRLRGVSGKGDLSFADVFDFAYADLDPTTALVYRRIGLHPGPEVDAAQAAALTDLPVERAAGELEALAGAHLAEPLPGDRYRLHELVRVHAGECSRRDDIEADSEAAIARLVDWHYGALRNADRAVVPDRLRLAPPEEGLAVGDVPSFDSAATAFEWFTVERANIIAVLRVARDREWDDRVWQLAEALWLFYYNRKHFSDWIESTEAAVASAVRIGDPAVEGRMRSQLARAHMDLRDYARAHTELLQAEQAAKLSGHESLCASIREFIGICYLNQGEYGHALDSLRSARAVFERCGSARGVAIQDYHIGSALTMSGDPHAALEPLRQALETMRAVDDRINVGRVLLHLGRAMLADGRPDEAEGALRQSISIAAPLGIRLVEAEAYEELAGIAAARGQAVPAARHRRRAQEIYREMGHPRAEEQIAAGEGSPPA